MCRHSPTSVQECSDGYTVLACTPDTQRWCRELHSSTVGPRQAIRQPVERVKTVQCEDEIAGCASAVGAAFAGALAVTTTSGPGVCLKSEAMNLAVIGELPLVIVNVQRGGPSTGLPTKSEQTDLLQALYGRNGESPMPVIAATSPTNCFDAAYMACKIALEHMTPVVLLTDAFVANGSAAWKLPNLNEYPAINPPYVTPDMAGNWTPYQRNEETGARYWAIPGTEGFMHRIGGLEKSNETGAISTEPENHNKMVHLRQTKVDKIADYIPELEVLGDEDADLLRSSCAAVLFARSS